MSKTSNEIRKVFKDLEDLDLQDLNAVKNMIFMLRVPINYKLEFVELFVDPELGEKRFNRFLEECKKLVKKYPMTLDNLPIDFDTKPEFKGQLNIECLIVDMLCECYKINADTNGKTFEKWCWLTMREDIQDMGKELLSRPT